MSTRIRRSKRLVVLFALPLLLALAGCGGSSGGAPASEGQQTSQTDDMEQLVEAAKEEGSVTFYETPGESKMREWVQPFQDTYGIEVNLYRAPSVDVFKRFTQEEQAGRHLADLVAVSVPQYIQEAIDNGWALSYSPQSADKLDQDFVLSETAYPLYVTTHAIAWNTDKVSPEEAQAFIEDGYQELLDPKWKGRIAIVTAAAGGGQLSTYHAIAQDSDLGWEYLEKLAAQQPAIFESAVTMTSNALAAGEYAVAFPSSDTTAWPAIADGAPLQFAYPQPAESSTHWMFLSANAPHPNAARLFMEWAMSLEPQTELAQISGGFVAHSDWVDDRAVAEEDWYRPPEELDISWATDPEFEENLESLTQRWLTTFGQQ